MVQPNDPIVTYWAAKIGVPPLVLWSQIMAESGWNPVIKNKLSSARGLIQFMDKTAKVLGFAGGSLELINRCPTVESQMPYVYAYYKNYMPFKRPCDLYLATFYPVSRNWPLDRLLPESIRKANPNIQTPGDYVNHVENIAREKMAAGGGNIPMNSSGTAAYTTARNSSGQSIRVQQTARDKDTMRGTRTGARGRVKFSEGLYRDMFRCSCCDSDTVDATLIYVMRTFMIKYGRPLKVYRGNVCSKNVKALNGCDQHLAHLTGKAADVVVLGNGPAGVKPMTAIEIVKGFELLFGNMVFCYPVSSSVAHIDVVNY